jgi:uncharacterized surface protein with fasciclin (FAS1) repeats
MKNLSCRLIATTLTLALAACAAKSTPSPEPPASAEPPPVEAAPPAEVAPAPEPAPVDEPAAPATPSGDLIDTIEGMGSFGTFVKLIEEAGLTQGLREDGPLTLFAPDDAAFAKLAAGELDRLRKDKKSLAALLNYHVLPGRAIKSTELGTMPNAKSAAGPEIAVESADGTIKLNGAATVVKADIMTTNGVIHVIDVSLSPTSAKKRAKASK